MPFAAVGLLTDAHSTLNHKPIIWAADGANGEVAGRTHVAGAERDEIRQCEAKV